MMDILFLQWIYPLLQWINHLYNGYNHQLLVFGRLPPSIFQKNTFFHAGFVNRLGLTGKKVDIRKLDRLIAQQIL
ncbi:MAG: hypothetical protein U9Q88_01905 [Bacillota bacterium]|nr:hypothetical protein [Bacillota bacterium]